MKNTLVTGGAGFIGSNFIHHLLGQNQEIKVINLDALTYAGNLDNLAEFESNNRYVFIHGDIRDAALIKSILTGGKIDTVVHFAAESHVDRSIENPIEFILTNVVGTANLLNTCLAHWNGLDPVHKSEFRFLHISTDEVFGSLSNNDPAFSESTPYSPNSPYAASKASADLLVRAFYKTYNFPAIISNCSNNYGPYQYPEKLIPLIILNCLEGRPLPLYGDGQQIRDWLYVEDHCEALFSILKAGLVGHSYNIGGGNQPSNLEITRQICHIMDKLKPDSTFVPHERLITYVKDRPGHDRRYAMDISKISKELGWQPNHDLAEGLEETVRWYLAHMDWVNAVRNRPSYKEWIDKNYNQREKV